LKVLVAEDNPLNQKHDPADGDQAWHHVDVVANGRGCGGRRRQETYDAVLMDVLMPEMARPAGGGGDLPALAARHAPAAGRAHGDGCAR